MPTYAYRCTSCGARYERQESFSAPSSHDCPTCGKLSKRVFLPPTIVFKGSGWYSTDHKRTLRGAENGSSDAGDEKSVPDLSKIGGDHGHSHDHGHDHGHGHDHSSAASEPKAEAGA